MPKAGIITVVGKPNAGKSTLLNRIIGEKLSIVSPKPQSTRDRIVGIQTTDDAQMIFLDTPGLLNPRYPLQQSMRGTALAALNDADVVLYLVDGTDGPPRAARATSHSSSTRSARRSSSRSTRPTSSTPGQREALARAASRCALHLGQHGRRHRGAARASGRACCPRARSSIRTTRSARRPCASSSSELVRETALEQLEDEVPYSVACEIEEFRESQSPVYIRAVLHVERESQKRILIGAGGKRVRDIGRAARRKIEALVGSPVYLDLWVKVLPNWRRNPHALHRLGYKLPEDRSS